MIMASVGCISFWVAGVARGERAIGVDVLANLAIGVLTVVAIWMMSRESAVACSLSVDVDSTIISVTESAGSAYTIDIAAIEQVRVKRSYLMLFTSLVTVLTNEGRQYALPMRMMEFDALAKAIATAAGLNSFRKEGGWEVYYRSEASDVLRRSQAEGPDRRSTDRAGHTIEQTLDGPISGEPVRDAVGEVEQVKEAHAVPRSPLWLDGMRTLGLGFALLYAPLLATPFAGQDGPENTVFVLVALLGAPAIVLVRAMKYARAELTDRWAVAAVILGGAGFFSVLPLPMRYDVWQNWLEAVAPVVYCLSWTCLGLVLSSPLDRVRARKGPAWAYLQAIPALAGAIYGVLLIRFPQIPGPPDYGLIYLSPLLAVETVFCYGVIWIGIRYSS